MPEKRTKSDVLYLRLKPDEKERLQKAADLENMTALSEWARVRLLKLAGEIIRKEQR